MPLPPVLRTRRLASMQQRRGSKSPPRIGPPWRNILSVVVPFAAVTLLIYSQVDLGKVQAQAARLPASVAFLALVILPLLGFPASLLHIASGIRFGAPLGLALVSLSILLQLLASYAIVHHWRE